MPDTSQARTPNIHIAMDSRPENVPVVREVIAGLGAAAQIDVNDVDDIKTAVTEACNNVVQHAYDEQLGPVEVDVELRDGAVEVAVRDRGPGIQPSIAPRGSGSLGIGVLVIKALAESVQFSDRDEEGLEVRMRFASPRTVDAMDMDGASAWALASSDVQPARSITITIGPPTLAISILPRMLCAIASRAHFSTDRLSDLEALGETVAHCATNVLEGTHLTVGVAVSNRQMRLTIGPLQSGGAMAMRVKSSVAGVGPLIDRLTDTQEARMEGEGEVLILQTGETAPH